MSQQRVSGEFDYAQAATTAARLARAILAEGLPRRTFLNVNLPKHNARGIKVTVQARRNHKTSVAEAFDPRRQPYYWIDEAQLDWEPHDRSDYQAVRDGWISVTPLQPDWTAHHALDQVDELVAGAAGSWCPTPLVTACPGETISRRTNLGDASKGWVTIWDCVGAWLSLVEHSVRDRGVGGSNPLAPTTSFLPDR